MTAALLPSAPSDPVPLSAHGRFWGLVPCAGMGLRAVAAPAAGTAPAPSLPKQYHLVAGQPMVLHTLAAFSGVSRLLGTLVAVAAGDHFLDAYAHPSFFRPHYLGADRHPD